jgi:amino acid transporter
VRSILFCYSRDRAVPLSWLWVKVDPWTKTPLAAVWGVALAAFCLGLPMLGSTTAFNAVLSLSTISLVVAYVTPITARISWGRAYFTPGPFHLGVAAYPLGVVSTLWMLFSTVVFCLPTQMPVDAENLNYAAAAFGGVTLLSCVTFFFPRFGAYAWFRGPVHTVDACLPAYAAPAGKGDEAEGVAAAASRKGSMGVASDDARLVVSDGSGGSNKPGRW